MLMLEKRMMENDQGFLMQQQYSNSPLNIDRQINPHHVPVAVEGGLAAKGELV